MYGSPASLRWLPHRTRLLRVNPTIEEFNQRVVVDGDYQWFDRMYLLPLSSDEVYSNPQMVQAPGY